MDSGRLIDQLKLVRFAVIVGDHGTGKSTLLHTLGRDLELRFPGGRWVQLTRSSGPLISERMFETLSNIRVTFRAQKQVAQGGVLVIDGAEQLPGWARAKVVRNARKWNQLCLITTHDHVKDFETIHETSIDPCVVGSLVVELLKDHHDGPWIESVKERTQHPITNVRTLWSDLYDEFEIRMTTQTKSEPWPSA
jgi:hypothetical protein